MVIIFTNIPFFLQKIKLKVKKAYRKLKNLKLFFNICVATVAI